MRLTRLPKKYRVVSCADCGRAIIDLQGHVDPRIPFVRQAHWHYRNGEKVQLCHDCRFGAEE